MHIEFINNEQYTKSQISVRIHSSWWKKLRMTKEKMVGETNMKTEQVWYSSCSVADDDNDDDDDDNCEFHLAEET